MSAQWQQRTEAGSSGMVRFIRWVALDVSPSLARAMLHPITWYFLLMRGPERRASRNYLRRVLGREPTLAEVARHVHTFAASILDRVALLTNSESLRSVRVHGGEHVERLLDSGRGVLLFGSHLGSFEAVRHAGFTRTAVPVRILMDGAQNPQVTALLEALNPRARESVIDAREDATSVLLRIHETLQAGGVVGLLADRPHAGEGTVPARLLAGTIALPEGPFRIAAVTGAPVLMIFGLLKADGTYDVYFEPFAERIEIRRQHRQADIAGWAQRFAGRLEARIREAPYNWFNFYEYWQDPLPPEHD